MNKRQIILGMLFASVFGGLVALGGAIYFAGFGSAANNYNSISERQQVQLAKYGDDDSNTAAAVVPEGLNFVAAAEKATPGVVHIRSGYGGGQYSSNPLDRMLRQYGQQPQQSSGSGVIVSDDGYIVTNNHVIDNASKVEVVLDDNREYTAKVIGSDPTTDLALIKIEESNLPFLKYGNSDKIKPGEWVLAVGNPFNLTSTVTAGIVSAKARNIGILRDKNNLQIESFIQTDAAVNPGNSGGALVNLDGDLIGINTAIATPTGTYAGYSFAVPVALVKKVMDDLLEFGEVQRGLLGIRIEDVNAQISEDNGLDLINGVYIREVNENSAAQEAGLKKGDVIVAVNGKGVDNVAELQELVARNRPGDEIEVTYNRDGKEKTVGAVLKNYEGNTDLVKREVASNLGGATFESLKPIELEALGLEHGVRVKRLSAGKLKDVGVQEGFVITSIDNVKIESIDDVSRVLENKKGAMLIVGVYSRGEEVPYGLIW